jgi:TetR/AcrR family transcriptional regulator, lmrAB and yxaGH operons repressor
MPTPPTTGSETPDTRSRILHAAQRLFRQRGYHATGLNDILDVAQAPKGSMYHHFPGGKEQIGVAVIESMTLSLLSLFAASRARSTEALVAQVGEQLVQVAEKTNYDICAMYSGFVAARNNSPLLGQAVQAAYQDMLQALQARLLRDGQSPRSAKDKAQLVVALLEGGSLLAQAQHDANAFRLAVRHAALMCRAD